MPQRVQGKILALLLAVVLAAFGAACKKADEDSIPEDTRPKVVLGVNVNDEAFPDGVVITDRLLPGEAVYDRSIIIIEAGCQGTVTLKDLDVTCSDWSVVSVEGAIANPVLIEGNVSLTAPFGDAFSGSESYSIELIGKASMTTVSERYGCGIVLKGDKPVMLTHPCGRRLADRHGRR